MVRLATRCARAVKRALVGEARSSKRSQAEPRSATKASAGALPPDTRGPTISASGPEDFASELSPDAGASDRQAAWRRVEIHVAKAQWDSALELVKKVGSWDEEGLSPEEAALAAFVLYYSGDTGGGRVHLAASMGRHGSAFLRELRRRRAPESEAYRTSHRMALKDAEMACDSLLPFSHPGKLHVEAARLKTRNRSRDAAQLWEDIYTHGLARPGLAEYHLALAQERDGQDDAAIETAGLAEATKFHERARQLADRIRMRQAAASNLDRFVDAAVSGDLEVLRQFMSANASLLRPLSEGDTQDEAVLVAASMVGAVATNRALDANLATREGSETERSSLTERRGDGVVLLSGFEFSGAGAVRDYLLDHQDVRLVLGDRYRGSPSLARLFAGLAESPSQARRGLLSFVGEQVLGIGATDPNYCLRTFFQGDTEDRVFFARSAAEMLARVAESPDNLPRLVRREFGEFLELILRRGVPPGGSALAVNLTKDGESRLLQLLPRAKLVFVIRDPRDQYADQYNNRSVEPAPDFIGGMRTKYENLSSIADTGAARDSIAVLRFEEFASNSLVRDGLLSFLGLDPLRMTRESSGFDPSASSANIGIHTKFPDQGVIEQIAKGLHEYLYL